MPVNESIELDHAVVHDLGMARGATFVNALYPEVIPAALKGNLTPPRKMTRKRTSGKGTKTTTAHPCTREGCNGQLRRIKGKHGFFWGCSNYRNGCRETRKDSRGKPARISAKA